MLFSSEITISCRCSWCGNFAFFNISLFNLQNYMDQSQECRCRKSGIRIFRKSSGCIGLEAPCIECGGRHSYTLKFGEIMTEGIITLNCIKKCVPLCFIGRDHLVRKRVDALEEELEALMDSLGYDSYFLNTHVMFDSLNKVHEIAETGNLSCRCGSKDIELTLLPDRIVLKCRQCDAGKSLDAASNEDLKRILASRRIVLPKAASPKCSI